MAEYKYYIKTKNKMLSFNCKEYSTLHVVHGDLHGENMIEVEIDIEYSDSGGLVDGYYLEDIIETNIPEIIELKNKYNK